MNKLLGWLKQFAVFARILAPAAASIASVAGDDAAAKDANKAAQAAKLLEDHLNDK